MKTDVPLKRNIQLRPADLLPLFGVPAAKVIGVESLELPASATSIDTVLRLRQADGQEYLHLIEWQGWRDPKLLWRTLGYLAWLGQNRNERPILATIVYLTAGDDVGDTLDQRGADQDGWTVTLPCVRLWQHDAHAALATGSLALVALTPLMQGASEALVEQAARTIIDAVAQPVQGELLAALGMFAEPLVATERFIRLVTRERLMSSSLISYLFKEELEEAREKKDAELRQTLQQALQQALTDVLVARFPATPEQLVLNVHRISDPTRLQGLIGAIAQAADLAQAEQLLTEAVDDTQEPLGG